MTSAVKLLNDQNIATLYPLTDLFIYSEAQLALAILPTCLTFYLFNFL